MQQPKYDTMFGGDLGDYGNAELFAKLKGTDTMILNGDHDVFGDLYHYPEERTLDRIPTIDVDQDATRASREKMEEFLKETGAQLWIQYDKGA